MQQREGRRARALLCALVAAAVPLATFASPPAAGPATPPAPPPIMASPGPPTCALSPPPDPAEIDLLIEALDDDDYQTRVVACRSMKRRGACWLKHGGGSEPAGACAGDDGVYRLFGPETFVRTAGPPDAFHRLFAVTDEGELCVRIENDSVASAWIAIDGDDVLSPSDFAAVVTELTVEPAPGIGEHALDVTLASAPGASLSVEIRFAPESPYDDVVGFFERALADESQNVVREALAAAGQVPTIPVWEIVRDVIQRGRGNYSSVTLHVAVDAFVRMSRALYPLQPDPVDALAVVLFNDRAASVRASAAIGLAKLRTASGIEVLEGALAAETNPMVQDAIRSALAQLRIASGSPGPSPVLPVAP